MPRFGTNSRRNLATAHQDLQALFNEVILHFDCSIICGHRGEADQNAAFAGGRSKLRYPQSKHNAYPSLAVDAVPYPVDWHDLSRFYYFGGFVMATAAHLKALGAMDHAVRWGGDWDRDTEVKDQTFNDLPHFELVPQ